MPHPTRLPLLAALLVVVSTATVAAGAALEPPDLRTGEYWTFHLLEGDGSRHGNGTVHVEVGPLDPNRTRRITTTTTFVRSVGNGSFDVTVRTGLQVEEGGLGVLARESVTIRDGSFEDRRVWSYSRNITRYDEPLPLLPAPSDPGDVWETRTDARSVVNQTDHVGEGDDARNVTYGPTRFNHTVDETLRVERVENVTVPAGTFEAVVVNRSREGQAGYTLEWWGGEPDYMVRWSNHAPDGNATGGAELADWGYDPPPEDEGFPLRTWALAALGVGVLAGAGWVAWRRMGG